jgi:serine/threonine protein kinase
VEGGTAAAIDLGIPGLVEPVEVGRGGFGIVYRARQTALRRHVAVKVLQTALVDHGSVDRFAREGTAMGALSVHPNVVVLYEHGLSPVGAPYLVLEYLSAGTLADRLESAEAVDANEGTRVGVLVAGALESAHQAGVLHLDVKPENILLGPFGEPKLGDFGIARMARDTTITSDGAATAVAGPLSLLHAAPELVDGQSPTAAADTYSLASTIHELLSGSPPFLRPGDTSILPMLSRLALEDPPDLTNWGVPAPIAAAVAAALAKDPGDRPASSVAFGEALNTARVAAGLAPVELRVLTLDGVSDYRNAVADELPRQTPSRPPRRSGRPRPSPKETSLPGPDEGSHVLSSVVAERPVPPTNPRHRRALLNGGLLPSTGREAPELRMHPIARDHQPLESQRSPVDLLGPAGQPPAPTVVLSKPPTSQTEALMSPPLAPTVVLAGPPGPDRSGGRPVADGRTRILGTRLPSIEEPAQ